MARTEIDLDPVNLITIDAIGKPGQRVFYIQATRVDEVITLIVEKAQVQTLAVGIEQFLNELKEKYPDLPEASSDYDLDKMHRAPGRGGAGSSRPGIWWRRRRRRPLRWSGRTSPLPAGGDFARRDFDTIAS